MSANEKWHYETVSGIQQYITVYTFLRPVKMISLIMNRVNHKVGQKREIPEKKHMTTHKQNLAWPERSNPQQWDDERFRALKISILNHSTTQDILSQIFDVIQSSAAL